MFNYHPYRFEADCSAAILIRVSCVRLYTEWGWCIGGCTRAPCMERRDARLSLDTDVRRSDVPRPSYATSFIRYMQITNCLDYNFFPSTITRHVYLQATVLYTYLSIICMYVYVY